ncbi:hypothetical protein RBA41_31245 [Massilia sp. CCM 9210]|uniref:hypothetical protein n=1 Tax=Massilia scottii TaxID=3057166 RepID=UPI002796A518|nr:hypothetical protein [Massilia sp. CCM 9210]MDQ1817786.1 hypothetical protein [Massilia sp. CCM 9210]
MRTIDIQQHLSPVLAALLLKEFTDEQFGDWLMQGTLCADRDSKKIARFILALEEHRLELHGDAEQDVFCSVMLVYLEALLDPGVDALKRSGIEATASAATTTWRSMGDEQRTALWQEAGKLHASILPLIQ